MDEKKDIVGKEIEGYKIIKPIGQGKFSTVYQAENSEGVLVALKKIKIFDMMDPKQREKCLKEVELMKPLSHPNIIKYIHNFTFNNQLIIVTQWAEKGDLKRLIKDHQQDETPFEQIKIWDFLIQISSALKHMHQNRIMHRDLKPANIFIANDQNLKIGDLGLGRAFGSETIEAHSKVGTPLYMSPELLRDQGYQMNADVWSLGCICYQLAELRSPFRNQNQKMSLMDLFNNITKGQYKPISNKYSSELSDIIKKMIVADPNKRLSSSEVLDISSQNYARLKKTPKLDCFITMDDIANKLNLIDYRNFCKLTNHVPIHRAYFALKQECKQPNEQLFYFLEMSYWIMNLSKPQKNKQKAIYHAKTMIDWKGTDEACTKFLNDLQAFGIKHEMNNKNIFQKGLWIKCVLSAQLTFKQIINQNQLQVSIPDIISNPNSRRAEEADDYIEMQVDEQQELTYNGAQEEEMEETLEFQRSMLFKRGKKIETDNQKLLEKIREIDQDDNNIIQGKIDQKEWIKQCNRVDKQLTTIYQNAKEGRKNSPFENFQRIKLLSGKIGDLVKFVKPCSYRIFNNTQSDLERISRGQKRINSQLIDLTKQFAYKSHEKSLLVDNLNRLTSFVNEQIRQLQQIQLKTANIEKVIEEIGESSNEQPLIKLRQTIKRMKNDIKQLQTRKGLLEWQLRQKMKYEEKNESVMITNDLDF